MSELLRVEGLMKYFNTPKGMLHAVDNVNFSIEMGKTLGVVGESGCGKSTLGRTVIHLLDNTGGRIYFNGNDVTKVNKKQLRALRNEMQIIFQDPYSSIDPRFTVEKAIAEPLKVRRELSAAQVREETERLMDLVGIDTRFRMAYPHELDGGRRQRVVIARALAPNPKFIVCDEPVSALDVSIQAQVLNLLQDLQDRQGLTYLFITHDLSVVKHISDDIMVMYLGQTVEKAPSGELFRNPLHPYTKALQSAIPTTNIHNRKPRILLKGELTSPIEPKPGCRFAKRCIYATEACRQPQQLEEVTPGHFVACCRAHELNAL